MKIKVLQLLCICTLLTGATSCFDIFETIHFNKAKGGVAEVEINAERSRSQLMLLMQFQMQGSNLKVPSLDELKKSVVALKDKVNALPGISGAQADLNTDKFIFNLKFNFDNVASLNHALAMVYDDKAKAAGAKEVQTYSFQGNQFKREGITNIPDIVKTFILQGTEDMPNYTSNYFFAGKKIQAASNKKSTISAQKDEVSLSIPIPYIVDGTQTVANTIKF